MWIPWTVRQTDSKSDPLRIVFLDWMDPSSVAGEVKTLYKLLPHPEQETLMTQVSTCPSVPHPYLAFFTQPPLSHPRGAHHTQL